MKQHTKGNRFFPITQRYPKQSVNPKPNIPGISQSILLFFVLLHFSCKDDASHLEQPTPTSLSSPAIQSPPSVDPFSGVDMEQIDALLARMTLEEKIGQMVIWTPDLTDPVVQANASDFVLNGLVSGLVLPTMKAEDYLFWKESLELATAIPFLSGTEEEVSLHGQFEGCPKFPNSMSINALEEEELKTFLNNTYLEQCQATGIQFSLRPTLPVKERLKVDGSAEMVRLKKDIDRMAEMGLIGVAKNFSLQHIEVNDSADFAQLLNLYQLTGKGLPGVLLEDDIFASEFIKNAPEGFVQKFLRHQLGFQGLAFTRLMDGESPELKLVQGADLFVTSNIQHFFQFARLMALEGKLSPKELDEKVRRILKAKAWAYGGRLPLSPSLDPAKPKARTVSFAKKKKPFLFKKSEKAPLRSRLPNEKLVAYFEAPVWQHFAKTLFEKSVTCASDANKLLPLKNLLHKEFHLIEIGNGNFRDFRKYFAKYADFSSIQAAADGAVLPSLTLRKPDSEPVAVILLEAAQLTTENDLPMIQSINALGSGTETILVNFGNPLNLGFFEKNITFIQVYERNEWTEQYAAQALFGGVNVNGKLPVHVSKDLPVGASEYIYKSRVSFSVPEDVGIAPERLVGIDAIANTAIRNRAFPGCQVVIIKDGKMVYSKSFGHHTYKKERQVINNDLYDIASITKVAATTLAVMKLAEQQQLSINERLSKYTHFRSGATVNSVRLKNLLIHNSGLLPAMPISRFYNYRAVPSKGGCNDLFCTHASDSFNVEINPSLYFRGDYQDTIWEKVEKSRIVRSGRYRYSDLNFFLLQKAVEEITHQPLDEYVAEKFFHPIGLRHLLFRPTKKFPLERIVPTEQDNIWRKKLVHGYVHDPAAALMDGVGGNAGLFSNAEDLAVLLQMLADKGVYGGTQFFEEKTVVDFTTSKYGNHRALGFDKPVQKKYPTYSKHMPITGYGHNGFTGTCAWVDPDNGLVYVFLSNRIHPSANNKRIFVDNIRGRIHDIAYDALGSFDKELPTLRSE